MQLQSFAIKKLPFPNKKYSVIYADPPWEYRQGGRGAAKNHYKTMSAKALSQMPVRDICTDKAVLFMWATFPNLPDALNVMDAWGFTYKTAAFVWVKQNKKNVVLVYGWWILHKGKCGGLFTRHKQKNQGKIGCSIAQRETNHRCSGARTLSKTGRNAMTNTRADGSEALLHRAFCKKHDTGLGRMGRRSKQIREG